MAFKFKAAKQKKVKAGKGKRITLIDQLISQQEDLAKDVSILKESVIGIDTKVAEVNVLTNIVKAHSRAMRKEREQHEYILREVDMRSNEIAQMHAQFTDSFNKVNALYDRLNGINANISAMNERINSILTLHAQVDNLNKELHKLKKDLNLIQSRETIIID